MGGCFSKGVEVSIEALHQDDATGGLSEAYDVKHLLGSGSAGDAWLATERATGEVLAIKLMKRPIPPLMVRELLYAAAKGGPAGGGVLRSQNPPHTFVVMHALSQTSIHSHTKNTL
jgi:hypothetical protein